ncbi:MAG: sensor histidine kinase [Richelia sp. CSU_2_1]|nr:sensor histidine kinase [Richelia sp. CSU_2_1]
MPRSTSSLRLLLSLEWIYMGFAIFTEVAIALFSPASKTAPLQILNLVGFGLLGLKLPEDKLVPKILYTALEFGIILLLPLSNIGILPNHSLGLITVIRAGRMFRLPGRLVVTALVFFSFVILQSVVGDNFGFIFVIKTANGEFKPITPEQINGAALLINRLGSAFFFGMMLGFNLLLLNALLSEHQSRQELAIAHEQLRQYARRIEDQATLEERNRIAREIHDSVGHYLTAQSIQLENAALFFQSEPEQAKEFLTEAIHQGSNALREVRQSVSKLRSDPLQGKSLPEAIALLISNFQAITGIVPDCNINLSRSLSKEISIVIYRVLQEGLTNIAKHSTATAVTIDLKDSKTSVKLCLSDNGKGFDPGQNTTGFGLQGMRERIAANGGQLNIVSELGKGCAIVIQIPHHQIVLSCGNL